MYAKEHIRPKLAQLDQDKLARLYADLRRESLATGSFPITVRHLESMIRMSEASAKMNLREFVRSDDIDLAIQVTVGSFVSAQKMSIKKTLERVSRFLFILFLYRFSTTFMLRHHPRCMTTSRDICISSHIPARTRSLRCMHGHLLPAWPAAPPCSLHLSPMPSSHPSSLILIPHPFLFPLPSPRT